MIIPLTIAAVLAGLWMACVIANLIAQPEMTVLRARRREALNDADLTRCIQRAALNAETQRAQRIAKGITKRLSLGSSASPESSALKQ